MSKRSLYVFTIIPPRLSDSCNFITVLFYAPRRAITTCDSHQQHRRRVPQVTTPASHQHHRRRGTTTDDPGWPPAPPTPSHPQENSQWEWFNCSMQSAAYPASGTETRVALSVRCTEKTAGHHSFCRRPRPAVSISAARRQ